MARQTATGETQNPRAAAQQAVPAPIQEPKLARTDLTFRESVPIVMGFLVVAPFLALPLFGRLALRFFGNCGSTISCASHLHFGLWLFQRLLGADRLPPSLANYPLLDDALVSAMAVGVVIVLCGLFGIPIFGGFAPVLKVTQYMRARTGESFEFAIRDRNRPHLITVHMLGRFAGFPGEALVALKLHLPSGEMLHIEVPLRPVAEPAKKNAVMDYVFDPLYFTFTPPANGVAQCWLGYGIGPEGKIKFCINRRN